MYVFGSLRPQHMEVLSGRHSLICGLLDAGRGSVPAVRALPPPVVPEGLPTLVHEPLGIGKSGRAYSLYLSNDLSISFDLSNLLAQAICNIILLFS